MENVIYSDYMIPRKIQEDIEEAFGKENAPVLIKALEHGLNQVQKKNEEQRILLKSEIKDELTKDLVTKELFHSEIRRLEGTISSEIRRLEEKFDEKFDKIDEKFNRVFLMLKMIFYVMIAGIVLLNPPVANLIATVFSVAK
jgi:predicted metal-dependent hydrolase